MSQQRTNQKQRQQLRKSQHFEFNDQALRRYGKTTGLYFGTVDVDKNYDGYARWSDYITYDSAEITYAKDDLEKSIFIRKIQNSLKQFQTDKNKKQREQKGAVGQKILQTSRESLGQNKQPQVTQNRQRKSINLKNFDVHTSSQGESPFVVGDISQIKKQNNSIGRNSQKFLLQLLSEPNHELQEKGNNQIENRKSVSNREFEQTKTMILNGNNNDDKFNKKKRVTINDNGKIKLTTDSVSHEYDHLMYDNRSNFQREDVYNQIPQTDFQVLEENHGNIPELKQSRLKIRQQAKGQNQQINEQQNNQGRKRSQGTRNYNRKKSKRQKSLKNKKQSDPQNIKTKKERKTSTKMLSHSNKNFKNDNKSTKSKNSTDKKNLLTKKRILNSGIALSNEVKQQKQLNEARKYLGRYRASRNQKLIQRSVAGVLKFLKGLNIQHVDRQKIQDYIFSNRRIRVEIRLRPQQFIESVGYQAQEMNMILTCQGGTNYQSLVVKIKDQKISDAINITLNDFNQFALKQYVKIDQNCSFKIQNCGKSAKTIILMIE